MSQTFVPLMNAHLFKENQIFITISVDSGNFIKNTDEFAAVIVYVGPLVLETVVQGGASTPPKVLIW